MLGAADRPRRRRRHAAAAQPGRHRHRRRRAPDQLRPRRRAARFGDHRLWPPAAMGRRMGMPDADDRRG
ncbi:hypothetical protein MY55_01005 [Chromobacterium subtsugae]|nr:hypothetical protein MY55_01005 [Chromobacterium subtsugae]